MKKIAEFKINMNKNLYNISNTNTLLVNYVNQNVKYYLKGIYQACCINCNNFFTFDNGYTLYHKNVRCPGCGKIHIGTEIAQTNSDEYLPYTLIMTIYEYKNKIKILAQADLVLIGNNIYNTFQVVKGRETFEFDIMNFESTFRKEIIDTKKNEKIFDKTTDIGYFNSDTELMNASFLKFFNYKNKVNVNGTSIKDFLKILRECINKKMKIIHGYSQKNIYLSTSNHLKIKNSLFYLASKIRFWDMESKKFYHNANMDNIAKISNELLGIEWLKKVEEVMKKENLPFVFAIQKIAQLPNSKFIRKELNEMANLIYLVQIYNMNIDLATKERLYLTIKKIKCTLSYQNLCLYVDNIYPIYKNISFEKVLKTAYLDDIVQMYIILDNINKELLKTKPVKFTHLHSWLVKKINEQKHKEKIFEIPEFIIKRFELQLKNYNIGIIKKYSDLRYVGENLHNCVASYRNRINENLQLLSITNHNGKILACIEIKKENIVQAKLINNSSVRSNEEINKIVLDFAKKADLKIQTNDIKIENIKNTLTNVS